MSYRESDKRVLHTPFHSRTSALCETNLWSPWMAYTTVDVYRVLEEEYFALRNATGVFDLTPMTKYRIRGGDGIAYLDKLMTRDMTRLSPGRVMYGVWCNDSGFVLDDGTVFHVNDNEWWLCSQERHMDWLLASATGFNVEITDISDAVTGLAVQGPTSCQVLKAMQLAGVEQLKPFQLAAYDFEGTSLMVSRTGFTGDLGYELWIDPARAEALWDRLFEAGRNFGILPIGSRALDIVRIEAGFIQAGVDFVPALDVVRAGRGRTPLELGLDWLVDFNKPVFNGRRALLAERETGPRYRFVKLDVEGNKPANDAFVYNKRGKIIGHVTSATWSPSAKKNIALASLDMPWGRKNDRMFVEIYYNRELQWNKLMARCTVVDEPFFNPPRRRATPPLDY